MRKTRWLFRSGGLTGCVPGTARILKGEYISCYRYIASPRPSLMEAKGVAVWQLGGSINTRGESRSAEAGYRKCTGRRTETESGWSGGTSPQHRIKSSIHYKPGRYTRRSCAERCVFTPGDLPRVQKD